MRPSSPEEAKTQRSHSVATSLAWAAVVAAPFLASAAVVAIGLVATTSGLQLWMVYVAPLLSLSLAALATIVVSASDRETKSLLTGALIGAVLTGAAWAAFWAMLVAGES